MISVQAVNCAPSIYSTRLSCLNNLGNALQKRHEWTESIDDLNRAVRAKEEAVQHTPKDDAFRAIALNNLSNTLRSLFDRTGSIENLNKAIEVSRDAVTAISNDRSVSSSVSQ